MAATEGESQKAISPRTSTDTIILEKGAELLAKEAQSVALGAVEVLSVQVLTLLQYLDRKREKYVEGIPVSPTWRSPRSEVPGTPKEADLGS